MKSCLFPSQSGCEYISKIAMLTPALITAPRPSSLALRFLRRSPYSKVCSRLPYFSFFHVTPVQSFWVAGERAVSYPTTRSWALKLKSCLWHPSSTALLMSLAREDWRWLLCFSLPQKKPFSHSILEETEIIWGSSSNKRQMYVILGNQLQFQVKVTFLNTAKSSSRIGTTDGFLINVNDVGPMCVCTDILLCRLKSMIEWDNQTLSDSYIYLSLHMYWDWTTGNKTNLTVKIGYLWTSKLVIVSLLK